MKTLDFVDDPFDFVPVENLDVAKTIDDLVVYATKVSEQIKELESRVATVEHDVGVLSSMGVQLEQESSKLQLQSMLENILENSNVLELRCSLGELYGARQTIAKALTKMAPHEESLNTSCGVCMERTVAVFNINCGHTVCESCSARIIKCPFCRSQTNFRKLLFSS